MKDKIVSFRIYGKEGNEDIVVLTANGNLYGSPIYGLQWTEITLPDLYESDSE